MSGSEVVALGYVVITAEDLDGWAAFGESILGAQAAPQPVPAPDHPTLFLRVDERAWRIAVEQGPDGGTGGLGLEVADRLRFEQLKARMAGAGVGVKDAPELAAQRGVLELFRADDPAGVPLEFFYGAKTDRATFVSPRAARFVTGPQGVGHCLVTGGDVAEMYAFYVGLLGFRVSDVISFGQGAAYFTSPNPRHHTIAFAGGVPGVPPGLGHLMLEVDDIDTVGRALDRVYDSGVPLRSGLGRHTNDHMMSFYCSSPSGLSVEYGWGGREIESATSTMHAYDAPSIWGHHRPEATAPT